MILIGSLDYSCLWLVSLISSVKSRGDFSCYSFFSDMVPLLSLQTRREVSTSPITNQKINSTKTGGAVPGVSTRTRVKNTAEKLPSPRGRQVNSEEQWILMAIRFNVYVFFKKDFTSCVLVYDPPSSLLPLCQTGSPCDSIHLTMCFTFTFFFRRIKVILIRSFVRGAI